MMMYLKYVTMFLFSNLSYN